MTSKTQPRPILKKNSNQKSKANPVFFSGNETLLQEEDENSYENRYKIEHDKILDQLNDVRINICPCKNNNSNHDEHKFKKSCLKSSRKAEINHKTEFKKRPLSAVYIFHSKEIDNEIMKFLIKSTNNFLEDFKSTIINDYYDESQLFTTFKEKFISKLKQFLLNGESLISDQVPACNLGVTLSLPSLADIECFREKAHQEKLATSRSEQFSFKFIKENINLTLNDRNVIDKNEKNNPTKLENSIYGSLPTTSFLENYNKELNLRESVLYKSIRSKTLKVNQDSLLLAHAHAAFNKVPKDKTNKSILSTATTTKKIVRFADSFGLDLEKVKIITNNSFMDAFSQEFKEESEKPENEENSNLIANSNPFLVLIPLFGLRKNDCIIRLDDYIYDYENKMIKCIVRVRNLAYEKRVFARITTNNWKSCYDLDGIYVRSEKNTSNNKLSTNPVIYDLFGFCILIPEKSSLPLSSNDNQTSKPFDDCILRIEFALCCEQNYVSYWDNNSGENYKFQCFYNKTN